MVGPAGLTGSPWKCGGGRALGTGQHLPVWPCCAACPLAAPGAATLVAASSWDRACIMGRGSSLRFTLTCVRACSAATDSRLCGLACAVTPHRCSAARAGGLKCLSRGAAFVTRMREERQLASWSGAQGRLTSMLRLFRELSALCFCARPGAVFGALNRVPEAQHGADVMRVREAALSGWAGHLRQTLLLASFASAEANALAARACANRAGRVRLQPRHAVRGGRVFRLTRAGCGWCRVLGISARPSAATAPGTYGH